MQIICLIGNIQNFHLLGVQPALQKEEKPNAVFCANDLIAIGAMDALRYDLGIKVPQEVGIVGFNDVDMAGWEGYSVTTIRQPLEKMVDEVCRYFYQVENGIETEGGLRLIPCQLVERKSTQNKV